MSKINLWNEVKTFIDSIENRREIDSPYTFLEGRSMVNGKLGIHHVNSRLSKGIVCNNSNAWTVPTLLEK